jgi:hypothetical protein
MTKIPRKSLKEKGFILALNFRGFGQWDRGPIALG